MQIERLLCFYVAIKSIPPLISDRVFYQNTYRFLLQSLYRQLFFHVFLYLLIRTPGVIFLQCGVTVLTPTNRRHCKLILQIFFIYLTLLTFVSEFIMLHFSTNDLILDMHKRVVNRNAQDIEQSQIRSSAKLEIA